ncbi:MAG: hypothetical protein IKB78_05800 [Clostridia bacterium]|nr:hypothetical protein [Clostridia bacterium]
MVGRYQMDGGQLPTIPTPHDCVVTQIDIDNDCIVFRFENEIAEHDAVRTICPDAKSLTIRYHLTQYKEFFFYKRYNRIRPFFPTGFYREVGAGKLNRWLGHGQPYLYHYVSYCSIIVQLLDLVFVAEVDWVELEWIQ